jgi:hypothetical protein
MADEGEFSVVAVAFFGKLYVGTFRPREKVKWRATELNAWSERNPRAYVQYVVRPEAKPGRGT